MNAVDVEPSRLDAAKTQTLQFIDQMSILDEMMIVSCNNHPVVHSPFTNHRKSLRQAVERITATDIATDLNPALELAYSVAQTKEHPEIIIFSDFQNIPKEGSSASILLAKREEGSNASILLAKEEQSNLPLHFVKIGDSSDNVGITKFQVRRSMINAFDYQTLLTVSNMSDEDKKVNVELHHNDVLFDVRPFELVAGQSKSEIYASFNVEGGELKAVLDVNDSLATDNIAYAVLPEKRKLSVLLVTYGNLFLEKVLQVNESLNVSIISPTEYANESKKYDAVILDNFCPQTLEDRISTNYMLIYPPPEESPWETGEKLDAPIVTEWNRTHPILNYVNLQNVQLSEGYKINPPPEARVLARSFEDALILTESKPNLKLVFIAFDIDKSDLPLRIAFPVIMANSFSWFQSETSTQQKHIRTGDILSTKITGNPIPSTVNAPPSDNANDAESPAPPNASNIVTIIDPDGNQYAIEPKDDQIIFDKTSRAGFYELQSDGKKELWAANLTDEQESDIRTDENFDESLTGDLVFSKSGFFRYPLWFYFVLAALLLTAIEWFLYQRRRVA